MDHCGICFGSNDCVPKLVSYKPSDSIIDSIIDIKTDSIFFIFSVPVQYQVNQNPIYIQSEQIGELEFAYVTGVTLADSIIAIVFNQPLISYDSLTIILDPCKIKNLSLEDYNNLYCLSNNLEGIPDISFSYSVTEFI